MSLAMKLLFVPLANAQRETIWSSPMQLDANDWTVSSGGIVTSGSCPVYATCYELQGRSAEMYRYNSTVGYHSIQVDYVMESHETKNDLDGCELYTISGQQSNILSDWNITSLDESEGTPLPRTINLPITVDNEPIVGIKFYINGGDKSYCYYNNINLSGILITQPPTNNPTSNPTTDSPTINPTLIPTTSLPTSSPTNDPTLQPTTSSPSKYPTNNPTTSPTTSDPTTSHPTTFDPTTSPSTSDPTKYPTTSTINPTIFTTTKYPTNVIVSSSTTSPIKSSTTTVSGDVVTDTIEADAPKDVGDENEIDQRMIIVILCGVIVLLCLCFCVYIVHSTKKKVIIINNEMKHMHLAKIVHDPKGEEFDTKIDGLIDLNPAERKLNGEEGGSDALFGVIINTGATNDFNGNESEEELYTQPILNNVVNDYDESEELYKKENDVTNDNGEPKVDNIGDDISLQKGDIEMYEPKIIVTKGYLSDEQSSNSSYTTPPTTTGEYHE